MILVASLGDLPDRRLRRRARRRLRPAPLVRLTLVMGTIFVLGQVNEYRELVHEGVTLSRRAPYGSVFYLTTGFHGLHVIGGLFAFVIVLAALDGRPLLARRRRPAPSSSPTTGTSSTSCGSGCTPRSTSSSDGNPQREHVHRPHLAADPATSSSCSALALVGGLYTALLAPQSDAVEATPARNQSMAVKAGRDLYLQGCSTCHGLNLQGGAGGPSLIGVGAAVGRLPGRERPHAAGRRRRAGARARRRSTRRGDRPARRVHPGQRRRARRCPRATSPTATCSWAASCSAPTARPATTSPAPAARSPTASTRPSLEPASARVIYTAMQHGPESHAALRRRPADGRGEEGHHPLRPLHHPGRAARRRRPRPVRPGPRGPGRLARRHRRPRRHDPLDRATAHEHPSDRRHRRTPAAATGGQTPPRAGGGQTLLRGRRLDPRPAASPGPAVRGRRHPRARA